jgi:hypothetical protein
MNPLLIRVRAVAALSCLLFFVPIARARGCRSGVTSCVAAAVHLSHALPPLQLEPWLLAELTRRELASTLTCSQLDCGRVQPSTRPVPASREPSVYGEWALAGGRTLTLNLTPTPGHCAPLVHLSF